MKIYMIASGDWCMAENRQRAFRNFQAYKKTVKPDEIKEVTFDEILEYYMAKNSVDSGSVKV